MIAIEAIARIRKRHCSKNNQCTDNCMHGDEYCEYGLALEALEKQIPKKPKLISEDYTMDGILMRDFECPACGNPRADDSYCQTCGQHLDWSDTNG